MKKKEKGFLYQMALEIIVIFIGITLALLIDSFKDRRQTIAEVKNHFNLILTEFSKDSLELNEIHVIIKSQINSIDQLCKFILNDNIKSFNEQMENFGGIRLYNPRTDEINLILNSSSYSQIYNEKIFSDLNNLKSDCKNFNFIQNHEYKIINEINDVFIFPNRDYKTKIIDLKKIINKNYFLNKLQEYKDILRFKKVVIESILLGSKQCINDVRNIN